MADAMEGIMGLPQSNGPATASANELAVIESYAQNNPKEFNSKLFEAMGEADPQLIVRLRSELQGLQLTVEELEALRQIVQDILMNPGDYQEIRQEMIDSGFDAEDLPEQFDGAYFQAFAIVLNQLEGTANPVEMAEGGLATLNPIAQAMQDMGRNGDTILAHINPQEAMVLKEMGGSGTINPATGLREYGFGSFFKAVTKPFRSAAKAVSKVFKSVTKAVKSVLASPVGRIIATIGLTMALGPTGFNLAGSLGSFAPSVALGINTAAASTLVGVASGQSFGDALKGGVISGVMAGVGGEIFGVPESYTTEAAGLQASGVQTGGTGAPVTGPTEMTTLAPGTDALGNVIPQADLGNYVNQGGMTLDEGLGFLTPDEVMTQATMANAPVDMASYGSSMMAEPAATFGSQAGSQVADLSANAANYAQGMSSVAPSTGLTTAPSALTTPTNLPTMADLSSAATPANPMYDFSNMQPAVDLSSAGTTGQYLTGNTASNFAPVTETSYLDKLMSEPLNTVKETATNFYDEYLSPTTNKFTGTGADMTVDQKFLELKNNPEFSGVGDSTLYKMAEKAASPGIMSTIGSWAPLAVAGTGVAAGLGAFETPPPPDLPEWAKGPTGAELLEQDPEKYGLNWGGVRTTYADLYNKGYSGYGSPDNPYTAAMRGYTQPTYAANGGEMTSFPRMNGHISGPGTGTSDDVPAMLSDGEFVMTANAVRGAGNGSRRAGAKKMYALMKALENRTA